MERAGRLALQRSAIDGALYTPAFGPLRLSFAGHGMHDATFSAQSRTEFAFASALSARFGATGAWAGVSRGGRQTSAYDFGAWRAIGPALVSIVAHSNVMRIGPRPTTFREVIVRD